MMWARVRASVRPLGPTTAAAVPIAETVAKRAVAIPATKATTPTSAPQRPQPAPDTLDRGWDRRLGNGRVMPDRTIDLHGHTLASAHALLDVELERAIARDDRVILLVTGKPPRPESERPHARGAIRAVGLVDRSRRSLQHPHPRPLPARGRGALS